MSGIITLLKQGVTAMYKAKKKVDLSHLFKLRIRKRPPVILFDCGDGKGLRRLKGVTSFTPPVMH